MNEKQGVTSVITYSLGNDEQAISMAVCHLISEGWTLTSISSESVSVRRTWEWDGAGEEEVAPAATGGKVNQ